jgi:hypothetical protein
MKKKRMIGVFIVLIMVVVALVGVSAWYLTFSYSPRCESFECFQESMERCSKVSYINEGPEASWGYEIQGVKGIECEVSVKLLQAKEGELGVDSLQGMEMSCFYPRGKGTYPEKDLDKCHGRLKEELQGIVIKKLHTHIIENLGKIDAELNVAV